MKLNCASFPNKNQNMSQRCSGAWTWVTDGPAAGAEPGPAQQQPDSKSSLCRQLCDDDGLFCQRNYISMTAVGGQLSNKVELHRAVEATSRWSRRRSLQRVSSGTRSARVLWMGLRPSVCRVYTVTGWHGRSRIRSSSQNSSFLRNAQSEAINWWRGVLPAARFCVRKFCLWSVW